MHCSVGIYCLFINYFLSAFIVVTDIQASKRPRLDHTLAMRSQVHSVDVVDLSIIDHVSTIAMWCPHQRLLSCDVSLMNPPGDRNCLFLACIFQLQNCSIQVVTTNEARIMRNDLMVSECQYLHSGGLFPLDENCHP